MTGLQSAGAGSVNLGNGNMTLRLATVGGGSFDPTAVYTYNSTSTATSPAGAGWSSLYEQSVTAPSPTTAVVVKGSGTQLTYTGLNASGVYQAPGGVINSLVQNGDGSWTETQPDGSQQVYAGGTGQLAKLKNAAGAIWTLTRDSSGRASAIIKPVGGRASCLSYG